MLFNTFLLSICIAATELVVYLYLCLCILDFFSFSLFLSHFLRQNNFFHIIFCPFPASVPLCTALYTYTYNMIHFFFLKTDSWSNFFSNYIYNSIFNPFSMAYSAVTVLHPLHAHFFLSFRFVHFFKFFCVFSENTQFFRCAKFKMIFLCMYRGDPKQTFMVSNFAGVFGALRVMLLDAYENRMERWVLSRFFKTLLLLAKNAAFTKNVK